MASRLDKGLCAFKDCEVSPAEGKKSCKEHDLFFERLRNELEENPNLIYNQRSDNPNRTLIDKDTGKRKKSNGKSVPVCCVPGCYEHRVPPEPYCDEHSGFAGGD